MSVRTAGRSRAEREAIAWEARLRGGEPDPADLRGFAAWHAGAAEHAAAWAALQERLARMGGHGARDAAAVAHALRSPVLERRRALRAGFGLGAAVLTGWGGLRTAHELGVDADWRSSTGQRGEGLLADGSQLRFDAASRIDLGTGASAPHPHPGRHPRLVLRQGQLVVQARGALAVGVGGIEVVTGGGMLAAGRLGGRTVVAVRDGGATLRVPGQAALRLAPGTAAHVDAAGVHASALSFNAATAWTRGVLVADRLPLPDLLDAYARYHPGLLRAGGAAAQRSISGVFRLADLDGTLRQLAAVLPLRAERYGSFVTVVS